MRKSPRQKARDNELKQCNARGCTRRRNGYSAHCSYHNRKKWEYGWTEGRRIYPKEYEHEAERVRVIITNNADHPGIQAGINFFQSWIDAAITGQRVLGAPYFQRLAEEGITGEDLLIECAGLYLYSRENPTTLPDDLPLTYALGISVLTKSKNTRGCSTSAHLKADVRRKVGQTIRERIGLLFLNIASTLEQRRKEAEEKRRSMAQPLTK